ncbi:MAG: insulinase family protein [Treponema sp.]|jgi:zinc protease|nr:insulinase family protein [Treponema sp.]
MKHIFPAFRKYKPGCLGPVFPLFILFLALTGIPGYAEETLSRPRPADLFTPAPDPYGRLGLGSDAIPAMKNLITGTLPNGLRYMILENSLPKERAYLTLAVKAGSVLENENERGLAHFTEHMAFNGTLNFPEAELTNYLRSLGMRFGPEINAYTSYDQTVYGIEVPTETGENGIRRIPEKALSILDDWTRFITFSPKDVDDERAVILEEYRSRLGAEERVREKIFQVIFKGSRYAHRLPIGLSDIIRNAPAERLEAFYKAWYRNENMALILIGDFDGKTLEKELASHFRAPASGPRARPYYELPGPVYGSSRMEIISDPELPYATVHLYYKRSYLESGNDLKWFRESLVDRLVSFMTGLRSEDAASKEEAPFIDAVSWPSQYGKMSRFYVMAAQTKTGQATETLKALLLEKESLERFGFSQDELDRAKASLVSYLEFQVSEEDRRESNRFIDNFVNDFLYDGITPDVEWELEAAERMLPGIDLEVVNAAVASYYADDDLTAVIVVPEKENVPLQADPGSVLKDLIRESREKAAPHEGTEKQAGLVQGPVEGAGSVINESADPSGAVMWTLSNGAKLILKETANRNNVLNLYALAKGGESSVPLGDDISAYMAQEIQNASGLGPLDRPGLSRFLSDKQLSLSFWTDTYIRGFTGETSLRDIESFFQLLYVSFTQPRIDDTGLNLVRAARRTSLLQEEGNPETAFSREVTKFVYGNHPRFKPLELPDLDRLSAEKAAAFLKKALNPQDYTFVFVGNLGPSGDGHYPLIRALAETWIASIPGTGNPAWDSWDDPGITRPGREERIVRGGKEQKSMTYMAWFSAASWTERDSAAVLVLNEYMDIILNDAIRESLGGVYSISGNFSLSPTPKGELSLGVFFICDPDRSGELRDEVKELLAQTAAGKIDEDVFTRAKEAVVKSFAQSMENNAFIARNYAIFNRILGIPLSRLEQRPELYRSVTTGEIRQILEQILVNGPGEVVLFPE